MDFVICIADDGWFAHSLEKFGKAGSECDETLSSLAIRRVDCPPTHEFDDLQGLVFVWYGNALRGTSRPSRSRKNKDQFIHPHHLFSSIS